MGAWGLSWALGAFHGHLGPFMGTCGLSWALGASSKPKRGPLMEPFGGLFVSPKGLFNGHLGPLGKPQRGPLMAGGLKRC